MPKKEEDFGSSLRNTQLDGYFNKNSSNSQGLNDRFFKTSRNQPTEETLITTAMQAKKNSFISIGSGKVSNLIERFKAAITKKNETFIHVKQYADLEAIPKLRSQTSNAPCYLLIDISSFKLEEIYKDSFLKLLDYKALPENITLICFANSNQSDDYFHPIFLMRFHHVISLAQTENTASQQLKK